MDREASNSAKLSGWTTVSPSSARVRQPSPPRPLDRSTTLKLSVFNVGGGGGGNKRIDTTYLKRTKLQNDMHQPTYVTI